jgi:hypothetical protein
VIRRRFLGKQAEEGEKLGFTDTVYLMRLFFRLPVLDSPPAFSVASIEKRRCLGDLFYLGSV